MNRNEFMRNLNNSLGSLNPKEIKEILYDYDEHFKAALEEGKNEQEIIDDLGDPVTIARMYVADSYIKKASREQSGTNILRAVFATIGLGFFNLAFVLGPFVGLAAVLFAIVTTGASLAAAGVIVLLKLTLGEILPVNMELLGSPVGHVALSISLISLGLIMVLVIAATTKFIYRLFVRYLKWNIQFIQGGSK